MPLVRYGYDGVLPLEETRGSGPPPWFVEKKDGTWLADAVDAGRGSRFFALLSLHIDFAHDSIPHTS